MRGAFKRKQKMSDMLIGSRFVDGQVIERGLNVSRQKPLLRDGKVQLESSQFVVNNSM